jgi:hypothetical protein
MVIIKKFSLKKFKKSIFKKNKELINTRRGIFETNSSSTHALVIHSLDYKKDDEERDIDVADFGWESKTYFSIEEKLSYLLTYAYTANDLPFYILLKNTFPTYKFNIYIINGHLIESSNLFNNLDSSYYSPGNLDHAYELDISELKKPELLKAFVLGDENYVITGNDNNDLDINDNILPNPIIVIRKGN